MSGRGARGVLMVTGAYWPELSGGGLQCRTAIQALEGALRFEVLTTCTDSALPRDDVVDGVPVRRVFVDVRRRRSRAAALLRLARGFARAAPRVAIVHLHGFSRKAIPIVLLSLLYGKRIVITMHTAVHDEPEGVRRMGRLAYWCFRRAHRYVAVSRRVARAYLAAGLPPERLRVAPNGLDVARFHPPCPEARREARAALGGLSDALRWILFVGYFSRDKGPDVLFDAWVRLRAMDAPPAGLLFVGATESAYHEVDPDLARAIRERAAALGVADRVRLIGPRLDVERAYHAADVFAMPTAREAFGMALVEAMACGLPVVASRLEGVTDEIVDEGRSGLLVPPRDSEALAVALRAILVDPDAAAAMGQRAREAVAARYGLDAARERWLAVYRDLAR